MLTFLWNQIVISIRKRFHFEGEEHEEAKERSSYEKLIKSSEVRIHKESLFDFLSKEDGSDINVVTELGLTPLRRAIRLGNVGITKRLIEGSNGANLNAIDSIGWTPLTFAVHCDELKIIDFLITYGGSDPNYYDGNQWTPLHRAIADERPLIAAIHRDNCEIVTILSTKEANLNLIDSGGWTPLSYAIEAEKVEMVKHLIDLGTDVNQEDGKGWAPLRIAIYKKNFEIIKLLSKNEATVNSIDSLGWTPLTYAIDEKKREIVKLLVENGADINDHCGSFKNAFHFAISKNNMETVKFFLENGADLTIQTRYPQDQQNHNSFDLAMKEDQMNILKQLLQYSEQ